MHAPTVAVFPVVAACLLALPAIGHAEVLDVQPGGFAVQHTAKVGAAPEAVWQAMMYRIEDWWHPDHSWSGDASNLYVDARVGGCFCERLPDSGGAVEHLRIIYFEPGRRVRFDGALGPLADMSVQGRMIWSVEPAAGEDSTLTFTYHVHGTLQGGFDGLAPAVDGVVGQQHQRLKALFSAD